MAWQRRIRKEATENGRAVEYTKCIQQAEILTLA